VSDLTDPVQVSTFTNGSTAITHNLYTLGNLVFAANYRSGLRVIDVSNPVSPSEVAFFDTYPENDGVNFNGLWSNYPYFPSGTIIGSDREKGLFVWVYGGPDITIGYPDGRPEIIDPSGQTLMVEFSEGGGGTADVLEATLHVDSGDGFEPLTMQPMGGGLFMGEFPALDCGATLSYYVSAQDGTGAVWRDPVSAPAGAYAAVVATNADLNYLVEFESNAGWQVGGPTDNATDGLWVRVDPIGTAAQPGDDHTEDGTKCYVTGQGSPGGSLGEADVDGGWTTLTSNTMNASGDGAAYVSYARWYSNDQGNNPGEDSMSIEISNNNGASWTLLEEVSENAGAWVVRSFRIDEILEPTSQMRLRFIARDLGGGSVVEAGVDDVRIDRYRCLEPNSPDINGDGAVDVDDLVLLILAWGSCPDPEDCSADLDGNGEVDVDDLIELISNWG
ncbi:MAG: choice-of-anchor B family protein, partial [Planctomycetota bacterium]